MVHVSNANLYEQPEHWDGTLLNNKGFLYKAKIINAMIPEDVQIVLDVGCGDGSLTNMLDGNYYVVGYDGSFEALKHVQRDKVRGDCGSLPFMEKSFDLVLNSQVLEHLAFDKLKNTVSELTRVTKNYLVIGVPYRDNIKETNIKCTSCRRVYNVWGHVRSFSSVKDVRKLFPKFKLLSYTFCGEEREYINPILLWIKQYLGNEWHWEKKAVCPYCANKPRIPTEKQNSVNRVVKYITDRIHWRLPKRKDFWWMVCLFERIN